MRILIVGSRNWVNYNEFMRNMTVAIEDASVKSPEDTKIVFVHTGQQGAENMVSEYVGKVDRYMKQKGYSVKEEIFRKKFSGEKIDRITADYDMITSGVDSVLVFVKDSCRRSEYCAKIAKEFGIPTKMIREK